MLELQPTIFTMCPVSNGTDIKPGRYIKQCVFHLAVTVCYYLRPTIFLWHALNPRPSWETSFCWLLRWWGTEVDHILQSLRLGRALHGCDATSCQRQLLRDAVTKQKHRSSIDVLMFTVSSTSPTFSHDTHYLVTAPRNRSIHWVFFILTITNWVIKWHQNK